MTTQNYEQQLAELKELQSKNQKIAEGAIRFNTQVENFQENYKKIIELADKKFNTHNIQELETKAQQWTEENTQRLMEAKKKTEEKENELKTKNDAIKQIQQGL